MSSLKSLRFLALVALISAICLLPATSASAAGVVNGGFETGTLEGWSQYNSSASGEWFTYNATEAATEGWMPPPQGNYAAITDEGDPDTAILYQDVTLPLYSNSTLSLTV